MSKDEKNSNELINLMREISVDVSADSKDFHHYIGEILKDLNADGSVSFFVNKKQVLAKKANGGDIEISVVD